ncbi:MAG TPA: cation diffusion facilitator family transporter [bacterium]|nr:cation diffusion facilitator family transporter [bacterium]HNT66425.1 cation diffusion facilitator family transporter [bacterium]
MHHHHSPDSGKNIALAFWLNVGFTAVEIAGAVLTNSLAIFADAIHDLGDSLTLGFSYYLERVAARKRDSVFSYGYRRFSLLAALISSSILIAGSMIVLSRAVPRLFDPQPVSAHGMMLLAVLGIVVNGMAALRLRRGRTLNESVVSWHLLEDVFGWVAILVTGIVLRFVDWPILDPLVSIAFTLFILRQVAIQFKRIWMIFLQSTPSDLDPDKITARLAQNKDVLGIHDLHLWSLDGAYHVLTVHVVVDNSLERRQIVELKQRIVAQMRQLGVAHSTLEIELAGESCDLEDC